MFISLNVYEMKPHVSPGNELQKIYIPVFKYHTHTPHIAHTCKQTHVHTRTHAHKHVRLQIHTPARTVD